MKKWRLPIIVLVGVVLVGAVAIYSQCLLPPSMGSGPAGPEVPSEPFEKMWNDGKVLLLGMGDSVTSGFGAGDRAHSYFNRLVENPRDEFADMKGKCLSAVLPNLKTRNDAVSCVNNAPLV